MTYSKVKQASPGFIKKMMTDMFCVYIFLYSQVICHLCALLFLKDCFMSKRMKGCEKGLKLKVSENIKVNMYDDRSHHKH